MTAHSGRGQGDPPLYEGVVLPANGDPWTPEQQRQVDQSHGKPLSGQPWGQPWGPESQAAVGSGEPAPPSLPAPPQAPPEQPPLIPHQQQHSPAGEPAAPDPASGGRHRGEPSPSSAPSSAPPPPDLPPAAPLPDPHGGQDFYGNGQLPQPASQPQHPQQLHQPQQLHEPHQPQQLHGPQQPPAGPPFGQGASAPGATSVPAPPAASSPSDATQYIPPVTGDAPQPLPYQPGQAPPAADADATQMLPPQTGQAPVQDPESTAQLRKPLPPEASAGGQGGQQQGQPQPPAGFESLFRAESPSDSGEPGSTQSLPLFDQAVARQRSGGVGGLGKSGGPAGHGGPAGPAGTYGQGAGAAQGAPQPGQWEPQGRAARRNAERSAISRMSPALLIAVGVAVVAGVGMVAGAALTGGEEEGPKQKSKSSAAPASERSAAPDPAEAQAKELDKLLADSNNSRASVISSVENIKSCKKLGQAARDLRAAAGQRNGLVTRLGKLQTDEIAAEAQLKSALTRAWKASASADNHYAAWADQTAGKKGCRKGKARTTGHVGLGARASGEATAAKKQAAGLWNPTAKKYGLKERQVGEL